MYEQLYQYLLLYKQLPLPGIGTFLIERKPAEADFANRTIHAPTYAITLHNETSSLPKKFFNWLAAVLNISERDAIVRFNDFAFELKKQIGSGAIIKWIGVGTLSNGLAGAVKFSPDADLIIEQSVVAEKIIRENYKHTVRVGEDERTSAEMVEMLNQPKKKQSLWWAYALVLALLSFIFICWYFSEHGLNVSSTANGKKLTPADATATYTTLP
jgi:hypothetical protein